MSAHDDDKSEYLPPVHVDLGQIRRDQSRVETTRQHRKPERRSIKWTVAVVLAALLLGGLSVLLWAVIVVRS